MQHAQLHHSEYNRGYIIKKAIELLKNVSDYCTGSESQKNSIIFNEIFTEKFLRIKYKSPSEICTSMSQGMKKIQKYFNKYHKLYSYLNKYYQDNFYTRCIKINKISKKHLIHMIKPLKVEQLLYNIVLKIIYFCRRVDKKMNKKIGLISLQSFCNSMAKFIENLINSINRRIKILTIQHNEQRSIYLTKLPQPPQQRASRKMDSKTMCPVMYEDATKQNPMCVLHKTRRRIHSVIKSTLEMLIINAIEHDELSIHDDKLYMECPISQSQYTKCKNKLYILNILKQHCIKLSDRHMHLLDIILLQKKRELQKLSYNAIDCIVCMNSTGLDGLGYELKVLIRDHPDYGNNFKNIRECNTCGLIWCIKCNIGYGTDNLIKKNVNIQLVSDGEEKVSEEIDSDEYYNIDHSGNSCEMVEDLKIITDGNPTNKPLHNFRQCPKCNAVLSLIDGCNKVKCKCGTSICYRCGEDITQVGYHHFTGRLCKKGKHDYEGGLYN